MARLSLSASRISKLVESTAGREVGRECERSREGALRDAKGRTVHGYMLGYL